MTKIDLGLDTSGRPLILDDTTLAKVRWAEAQLGWTFALIQGSYRASDPLNRSGGTHDAGGAVDLRTWDIPKSLPMVTVLTALRKAGLIAWYRPQSAFPDHEIHAIDYGDPNLSPSAQAQVTAYLAGRNGLSGSLSGPDDGPKVDIPKTVPGGPVTERRAVDYSFSRPSLAAIASAHYEGIGRYIGGSASKRLTRAEADAAHARGLFVWLVYESTAGRAGQGYAAGVADAKDAELQADALGYPSGAVIFYAVDFDATAAQVKPYFDGVNATAKRPVGSYGGIKVTSAKFTPYRWQTVGWSGGQLDQDAHLFQRVKPNGNLPAGCDENVILHDFPTWQSGKKPPPPPKDWFDMATQADLEAAIVKHIPDIAAAVLSATVTNRNPDGTSAPMQLGELLSQVEVAEDRLGARLRDMQTVLTNAEALLEKLPGA